MFIEGWDFKSSGKEFQSVGEEKENERDPISIVLVLGTDDLSWSINRKFLAGLFLDIRLWRYLGDLSLKFYLFLKSIYIQSGNKLVTNVSF